jgi:hypothetical protein
MWIHNQLGTYDILMLYDGDGQPQIADLDAFDTLLKLHRSSEIKFYFTLSDKIKQKLIDRYNKECVDRYNKLIREIQHDNADQDNRNQDNNNNENNNENEYRHKN